MSSSPVAERPQAAGEAGAAGRAPWERAAAVTIYLYDGIAQPWFDLRGVQDYLGAWVPWARTALRPDLLAWALSETGTEPGGQAGLAERLCRMRVLDPTRDAGERPRRPLKPELDFETRLLAGARRPSAGLIYDGGELQVLAFGLLARAERGPGALHVWFTERLFATWDDAARRYHARVSLYGLPSIVSSSGMVEAPALEREEYLARRFGVAPRAAEAEDGGRRLLYEDPRTAEIAKGYAMQAVFYGLTGEPFCDDPRCRLFNAHWQREMLAAQLGGTDFCSRHGDALRAWRLGGA